ncbi:MAG: OmpA family protein [Deltaproteobacteria bacterium]|nr:OmpA family protein [Deltaproteobacteria bacterium]
MARKKKPPEHVNHERWLVSYADFITLLFAFFTTLYAISTVDAKKAGKLVMSLRAVFDLDPFVSDKPMLGADSTEPPPLSGTVAPRLRPIRVSGIPSPNRQVKRMSRLIHRLTTALEIYSKSDLVRVTKEPRGVVVTLDAGGFFSSGSERLLPRPRAALDLIADTLKGVQLPVRVDGHTDSEPVRGGRFRSNWELSTSRAVTIVSYLSQKYRYPPDLLSAAGYGDTRPVVPNDTATNRAKNRRIEIVILREPAAVFPAKWVFDTQGEADD